MASMKKFQSLASVWSMAMMMMMLWVVVQNQVGVEGQVASDTCSAGMANLNVCTPFVVGGAAGTPPPPPSPECCTALQSVNSDCLCSTIRVASRLPSLCNLPPYACPVY